MSSRFRSMHRLQLGRPSSLRLSCLHLHNPYVLPSNNRPVVGVVVSVLALVVFVVFSALAFAFVVGVLVLVDGALALIGGILALFVGVLALGLSWSSLLNMM